MDARRGHRLGVPLGLLLGAALLNQFDDTAGLNIVGGQLSISLHYSASAIVANDLKVAVGIVSDQIDGLFFVSSSDRGALNRTTGKPVLVFVLVDEHQRLIGLVGVVAQIRELSRSPVI